MSEKVLFDSMVKSDGLPIGAIRNVGEDKIAAYAAIWGTDKYKDVTKEWFTADTDELTVIFDEIKALPWLIQHAMDNVLKTTPVGVVTHLEADDIGLYYETRITQQELYKKYIAKFIDAGTLFTSTGTLPGGRRVSKSGEITRWPIVEITGTWIPAQWQMMSTVDPREIKSVYDFMNLVLPESLIKALGELHTEMTDDKNDDLSLDDENEKATTPKDTEDAAEAFDEQRLIDDLTRSASMNEEEQLENKDEDSLDGKLRKAKLDLSALELEILTFDITTLQIKETQKC